LAPLGGIQPAEPAKNWLKVILDQLVSFVAGPRPGWLHKNLWITLNNLLYSNCYRENYTEPVPSIPESLLRAVKLQVDPDNPISSANLRIVLGDRKEVVIDGSSYLIELGDFDSTTFEEKQVTLD